MFYLVIYIVNPIFKKKNHNSQNCPLYQKIIRIDDTLSFEIKSLMFSNFI